MNRKSLLWIVALVVALAAGWQFASAQGEKGKVVQKWEYKVSVDVDADSFAAYGSEGWELVAVQPPTKNNAQSTFYFKRHK